jgi:uncharacterized protein (DUF433 family)
MIQYHCEYTSGEWLMECAMNDWATLPAIERDRQTVSGAWVFRGTRVPVKALFENLRDGATVDQFLEWFPGVTRAQVQAILDHEVLQLTADASA